MALDHYVSQVHLKRFYSPVLGELMHAIQKSDLNEFTPNASSVCRLDEGNTNEYLSEPRLIEKFLKDIEPGYNAAVLVLEQGSPDPKSVYVVAGFVSYVLTCSPAAMRIYSQPLKNAVEHIAKLADRQGLIAPPPAELGGKNLSELLELSKVTLTVDPKYPQAIGVANILRRVVMFGNFHWEALVNTHDDCPYFNSDFPVAIEPTADKRVLNRVVPLAPNIALRICPDISLSGKPASWDFHKFVFSKREVTRHEAIEINRKLVRSAENTVFYRDDQHWVTGFVKKTGISGLRLKMFKFRNRREPYYCGGKRLWLTSAHNLNCIPKWKDSAVSTLE